MRGHTDEDAHEIEDEKEAIAFYGQEEYSENVRKRRGEEERREDEE